MIFDRPVLRETSARATQARTARWANERTRRCIDEVASDEEEQPWAFFCECSDADCSAVVHVTLREFDRLVATERQILAEAHRGLGRHAE